MAKKATAAKKESPKASPAKKGGKALPPFIEKAIEAKAMKSGKKGKGAC